MKEIKFLNLANVPKINFVKAIKAIKNISLKEAKDLGDAVYDSNVLTDWSTEVEDHDLQYAKDILEQLGINYCVKEDTTSAIDEMKNSGVYLEATESEIKVTIVAKLPNDNKLLSRLKGFLTDAHCTVFMHEEEDHTRMEMSKYFPPKVIDLNSIIEFAHGVSTIISLLVDIKNVNERITDMERKIRRAFDKISW